MLEHVQKEKYSESKNSILIVDDDKSSRITLKLIFERKGFEVTTVETGKDALEEIERRFYNIVFLDIKLPDIEGTNLINIIKQKNSDIEIVMVTAFASIDSTIKALNDGASAYITKPLNIDEVLAIVSKILEKQHLVFEKRKADLALIKSEQKYHSLFENMLNGFALCKIILDDDNNPVDFLYLDVNNAFERLTRLKKEETIGKRVTEVLPGIENSTPNLFEICGKVALTGEDTKFEIFFEPLKIWLLISVYSPEKGYFVSIFENITERKIAEEMIKNEIEKLKELDQIKDDLVIRISHELKTPLISINSTAQLLRDVYKEEMSSKVFSFLEMINEGGIRLKNLINNLIEVYDIESQNLSLEYNSYNIIKLLQKCIKQTEYQLLRRKHVLKVDLPDEFFIQIDGYQIEKVFINILTNAIKFTPSKGEIFLQLLDNDDFIEILIKDTGIGFTEEEKKKLFTKFGKIERYGQNLDVDIEGVGLGLYLSNKIIELHKGEIILKSEGRNKGSIFIIRLYK